MISNTTSSSQKTGKETLMPENEKAQQVSKSAANRVINNDENSLPSYEPPQEERTGSLSDNLNNEQIQVRQETCQEEAAQAKESDVFRKNPEARSCVYHQSNRIMLLIMTALLFLMVVTFVLVILLMLGIFGKQCACSNQPLTEGKHCFKTSSTV